MGDLLDLDEAQRRVLQGVTPLGHERVSLDEAVGRVLARDLVSPVNLPGFDYSAMDGYAIDVGSGATTREVVGESRAGGLPPPALVAGTAMRILTGAPVPDGADAIVMQEETTRAGDVLTLTGAPKKGDHVRRAGEDLARGTIALHRGTRLRPSQIPLLAALEVVRPEVYRQPVVTVLATGDELREPGAPARPGTIIETNGLAISALARNVGARVRLLPIAPDDRDALRAAVLDALDGAEVALTIGGVSVGDHDLVKPILDEVGVVLDFWRVAIKPGKPLAMGRKGSTRVLGLPGNPVSAMLTFLLFAAPLLRALEGEREPLPKKTHAKLARDVKHHPGRTEFLRATLSREKGETVVTPIASQSSGSIVSMAWADALVVVPRDAMGLAKDSTVEIITL
jgi:molybdopterin molybdotransferase